MEQFAIPGVAALILRETEDDASILFQERWKEDAPAEKGMLEIPAGKVRAFESVYAALRREIMEETGLSITEILGENRTPPYGHGQYKVLSFTPYACSQNLGGDYPIMVFTFVCKASGNLLYASDESRNHRWIPIEELRKMLHDHPRQFYPMHLESLGKFVAEYTGSFGTMQ